MMAIIYRLASSMALISFFALVALLANANLAIWSWLWIIFNALFVIVLLASVNDMFEAASIWFPVEMPKSFFGELFFGFAIALTVMLVLFAAGAAVLSPLFFEIMQIASKEATT